MECNVMKELIQSQLINIEKAYNVKVLYAVESGSRAWGFPSKDSDYDIRFIYIHPTEWYLSIDPQGVGKKRDVIELPMSKELNLSGWEITKVLRLFRKSNPTIFEWLRSEPIYFHQYDFISNLKRLENAFYNPKALFYHYINMAKKNIQQHQQIKLKNYLYALRALFSCKWIELYDEIPPIKFQDLMEKLSLDKQLVFVIEDIIEKKISGWESNLVVQNRILENYIQSELIRLNDFGKKTFATLEMNDSKILDELFQHTLEEVWKTC